MKMSMFSRLMSAACLFACTQCSRIPVRDIPFNSATESSGPSHPLALRQARSQVSTELVNNATQLYGWQLAGSLNGTDDLENLCHQLTDTTNSPDAQELDACLLRDIFCTTAPEAGYPKPEDANKRANAYNTDIFITQVLNLAPSSEDFIGTLCKTMTPGSVGSYTLNATRVQEAVCQAADYPIPSVAVVQSGSPETEIQITQDASALFAWQTLDFVGLIHDNEFLGSLCDTLNSTSSSVGTVGLFAETVTDIMCGRNEAEPPSAALIKSNATQHTTGIFLVTFGTFLAEAPTLVYFCNRLEVPAMDAVGLNGTEVKNSVCQINAS